MHVLSLTIFGANVKFIYLITKKNAIFLPFFLCVGANRVFNHFLTSNFGVGMAIIVNFALKFNKLTKIMMKKFFMALALVFICCAASYAQEGTIRLVNKSGIDFYGVMMSASEDDEWEDIMGDETLDNGEAVRVTVTDKSAAWDIRFFVNPDEEDGYVEFQGLVFGNKTTLTLIIDEDGDLAYTLQ